MQEAKLRMDLPLEIHLTLFVKVEGAYIVATSIIVLGIKHTVRVRSGTILAFESTVGASW